MERFRSKFPRELLNEIKWTNCDMSKIEIYYINRGSPNDTNIINGNSIVNIDRSFLILEGIPYETYIPYHRITTIKYDDDVIFSRCSKM